MQKVLKKELPRLANQLGLQIKSLEASVLYYHHGLKNCPTLPKNLAEHFDGKDILDVGASVGDSAAVFTTYYKGKRIFCLEPDMQKASQLVTYFATQSFHNTQILNCAAGRVSGQLEGGEQVRIIDEIVKTNNLEIGLINMDIEGAEEDALAGARETIQISKPLLIISMYHNGAQFFNLLPMVKEIRSDYQFAVSKLDDRSPVYETTLFCY